MITVKYLKYKFQSFKERLTRKRKINVYLILETPDPAKNPPELKILSVVPALESVPEAIEALIKKDHIEHFAAWCKLRDLSIISQDAWNLYMEQVITEEGLPDVVSRYSYIKLDLNASEIANLMRSFHGCEYLGCSFEEIDPEVQISQAIADVSDAISDSLSQISEEQKQVDQKIEEIETKVKEILEVDASAKKSKKNIDK